MYPIILTAILSLSLMCSIVRFAKNPKEKAGFYIINAFAHLQVIFLILMMDRSLIHWGDAIDPIFYFANWAVIILVPLSLVLSFISKKSWIDRLLFNMNIIISGSLFLRMMAGFLIPAT